MSVTSSILPRLSRAGRPDMPVSTPAEYREEAEETEETPGGDPAWGGRVVATEADWPVPPESERRRGFPRVPTLFIGRVREVKEVRVLLTRHQLVTILGPGGIGKTRLALEVGAAEREKFGERIWFVQLASIEDAGSVESAVAGAVGSRSTTGRPLMQSVAQRLSAEPSLLVLDNCEHVTAAVAAVCTELLSLVDDVRILATSREPLAVPGEARLRLKSLDARASCGSVGPGPGHPGSGIELFLDRVRLVDPDIASTEQTIALVAQIVEKVDGLPLAIELAAARGESLGLAQLSTMLDDPLAVLTGGPAADQEHHRSLRATVEWSYRLLDDRQQRVFRRLAVCPAAFALEAATAIAGDQATQTVLHLVDCSLLTPPGVGTDGASRYLMLESVRAFARERLEQSGEQADAASAMAEYGAGIADEFAAAMQRPGRERPAALQFDNDEALLRSCLHWALDHAPATAVRLALALAPWWQLRGHAVTGYPLLARAVEGYSRRGMTWSRAQIWLGRLAHSMAHWSVALEHFTAVRERQAADVPSVQLVDALVGESGTLRNLIRLPEADEAARRAGELARQLRYTAGQASALAQMSLVRVYQDDVATSLPLARAAQRLDADKLPDRVARRVCLVVTLAHIQARALDAARESCMRGLTDAAAAGDVTMHADFEYCATQVDLGTRNYAEAGLHIVHALRLAAESGESLRLIGCLHDCARLCAATGRNAEAAALWAANSALSVRIGIPDLLPQEFEERSRPLRGARHALGPVAFDAAQQRGATMTMRTAAEFAGMLAAAGVGSVGPAADATMLTPRERELLTLVAQGGTDAQIADQLFISIRTVRSHLDRMRDKTGCRRRADLTRLALNIGLV